MSIKLIRELPYDVKHCVDTLTIPSVRTGQMETPKMRQNLLRNMCHHESFIYDRSVSHYKGFDLISTLHEVKEPYHLST